MQKIIESSRKHNIERRLGTPLVELFYNWHWKENLKHREIAALIDIPRPTVTRWFRAFDIPTQSCERFTNLNLLNTGPRKSPPARLKIKKEFPWKFNKNFFKSWSPEMAYVLGFLMADGYVFTNPRGSCYIGFISTDKKIIEKIRRALQSNHTIGVRNRKREHPNWKESYTLQIGSKNIFNHLKKLVLSQTKV